MGIGISYSELFITAYTLREALVSTEEKQSKTMTLPLPCYTVWFGVVQLNSNISVGFCEASCDIQV